MKVIYNETSGNSIYLDNSYPLTDDETLVDSLEFEFTVTGYNESKKNIYYAIEIVHGSELASKTRFLDFDIKLSLYENDVEKFKNQVFDNLDKRDLFYGYIKTESTELTPTINNYTIRLWINDNVLITDTPANANVTNKSVYNTEEFKNSYASFRINVRANISGESIERIFYDANGGTNTPKETSLADNKITTQKPVMENKGFLGWSEDKNATVPSYKTGDYYSGKAKLLYAVYGDTRNVMNTFPLDITNQMAKITAVYFINDIQENIDARYRTATIKKI